MSPRLFSPESNEIPKARSFDVIFWVATLAQNSTRAKLGTVAEGSRRVACPTGAELGEVVNAVRSRDLAHQPSTVTLGYLTKDIYSSTPLLKSTKHKNQF